MRKTFLILVLVVFVAAGEFEELAENFLLDLNSTKKVDSCQIWEESAALCQLKEKGYILFALNEAVFPVIAFSLKSDFNSLPPAVRRFYKKRAKELLEIRRVADKRSRFLKRGNFKTKQVGPFLSTNWKQTYPYNKFLPTQDGEYVAAGCVNIAMAQLMRYWMYPNRGSGVVSYEWNGKILKAVLNHSYNWELMPSSLENANEAQIDSIAHLIRDLAIANRTQLSVNNSGAIINRATLISNFGYSTFIKEMDNSNSAFADTLKNELDNKRVVLFSLPGHLTVADGYIENEEGFMVHLNMGWGGEADSFYSLSEEIETEKYNFSTESGNLYMLYNIYPCSGDDCANNLEQNDSFVDEKTIKGVFDYDFDSDIYTLKIEGRTKISADRGYSNQAIYLTLYDENFTEIANEGEKPLEFDDLKRGVYYLRVSLNYGGNYWNYEQDYKNYTVEINSTFVKADKYDHPPVLFSNLRDLNINEKKEIYLGIYDEDEDDIMLTISYPQEFNLSYKNSLLTIQPLEKNVKGEIVFEARSKQKTIQKTILVSSAQKQIYFGKEFELKDTFDDQNDTDTFKTALEGECEIKGNRGFSNQAFYIEVLNENEDSVVVEFSDEMINYNFPKGIYSIVASLRKPIENGYQQYNYNESFKNFTITVKCPSSTYTLDELNLQTQEVAANKTLKTKLLYLKNGWNLISYDGNLSNFENSLIVWGWKEGKWKAYSTVYKNAILNSGFDFFETSSVKDGIWVYLAKKGIIEDYNNERKTDFETGWSLAGSGDNIAISELNCQNGSLDAVFLYDTNWSIYAPFYGYNDFSQIQFNKGFWIKCK
jgi:uncharacterized protein YuzE